MAPNPPHSETGVKVVAWKQVFGNDTLTPTDLLPFLPPLMVVPGRSWGSKEASLCTRTPAPVTRNVAMIIIRRTLSFGQPVFRSSSQYVFQLSSLSVSQHVSPNQYVCYICSINHFVFLSVSLSFSQTVSLSSIRQPIFL